MDVAYGDTSFNQAPRRKRHAVESSCLSITAMSSAWPSSLQVEVTPQAVLTPLSPTIESRVDDSLRTTALARATALLTGNSVARLDDRLLAVLGGQSPIVRLSDETARKQAEKHPDIKSEDYARVQEVIDQGLVVRQGERTLVFVAETEEGQWWRLVVKRTADGRETYLVAFHRIKLNQIRSTKRRGQVVRNGYDQ